MLKLYNFHASSTSYRTRIVLNLKRLSYEYIPIRLDRAEHLGAAYGEINPMRGVPDDTPSHPLQTSIDVASLAPNAEITVFPWREPEDLKLRTVDRARRFLKAQVPMRAAAQ